MDPTAKSGGDGRWDRPLGLAAAVFVLITVGLMCLFPVRSDDIFMHLELGRRFFHEGGIPEVDPFLFSIPNYHWQVIHEWASHLVAYGIFAIGGWNALITTKAVLILAMAATPMLVARRARHMAWVVPPVVLIASGAACQRFIERSSLVSDCFTTIVVAIVLSDRRGAARLKYFLPLLFAIWVNFHPGFYPGLAVCLIALLFRLRRPRETETRRFAGCVVASALACFLNPRAWQGVIYPLRPIVDHTWDVHRRFNMEWLPTLDPRNQAGLMAVFFLVLVGLSILLLIVRRREKPWIHAALLAVFGYLGLSAIRFLPTAAYALATIAADLCNGEPHVATATSIRSRTLISRIAAGITTLVAVSIGVKIMIAGYAPSHAARRLGGGLETNAHPIHAAQFLDSIGLSSNLFNQHGYGAYLAWQWHGRRKLFSHGFVDDLDFFGRNYLGASSSPAEFARIVREFRLGAFLLKPARVTRDSGPALHRFLLNDPEWTLVYAQPDGMVFLRECPENADAFRKIDALPPNR
ncbi:MAG: hypothetical protein KF841_02105 [Phycisphaerae bacterium]|nr:hypothetical protein [Phycisphaerae bacterium]